MKDFFPALYNIAQDQQARVADYLSWHNEEMVWSVILLRASQDWEMEDFTAFLDILYTQKVNRVEEDHLSWDHTKSGRFEVRSYYRLTCSGGSPTFPWKSAWHVKVPRKVAFITWLAVHG